MLAAYCALQAAYTSTGTLLWLKSYGASSSLDSEILSLAAATPGSVYIGGKISGTISSMGVTNSGGNSDILLVSSSTGRVSGGEGGRGLSGSDGSHDLARHPCSIQRAQSWGKHMLRQPNTDCRPSSS